MSVAVVVPARNAQRWIEACLRSVAESRPAEVILVDGQSTDETVALARPWVDRVIDDGGAGVAAARMIGVRAARSEWIALIDADVRLPPHAVGDLIGECRQRGLVGLQARLRSMGAGDYWSQALADHHNGGRSKEWFGICATVVRRDVLLDHPLDSAFASGEDIDLRRRLLRAGVQVGVSRSTVVEHRFGPGFAFARDQWLADGAGLGRLVRKHGMPVIRNALVPFAAAVLGLARSLRYGPRSWPYFGGFALGNYIGLWRGLTDGGVDVSRGGVLAVPVMFVALVVLSVMAVLGAVSLAVGLAIVGTDTARSGYTPSSDAQPESSPPLPAA